MTLFFEQDQETANNEITLPFPSTKSLIDFSMQCEADACVLNLESLTITGTFGTKDLEYARQFLRLGL